MAQDVALSGLFAGVDAMPARLDPALEEAIDRQKRERELQELKENMDFQEDFINAPLKAIKEQSLSLKIHLVVAVLGVIAFHYTAHPSPADPSVFHWWIYPFFFFGITLSGHHYYASGNRWKGTALILIQLQIALFFVNKQLTPAFDWYWYPLGLSLMVGMYFYYSADPQTSQLATFSYLYVVLSILVLITWLNLRFLTTFPWFIYPLCVLAMPLSVWYMKQVYNERRWWLYATVVAVYVNVMVLFTWSFTYPVSDMWDWPWFTVSLLISCAVVFVLFVVHRQRSDNPLFGASKERPVYRQPSALMQPDIDLEDPIAEEYDYDG